ncbi:MAG: hypothetical protein JWO31_708, partial [Phycisphaerales bacterium]|nr:hypothetical protein [Phycisphaerales bacterium]
MSEDQPSSPADHPQAAARPAVTAYPPPKPRRRRVKWLLRVTLALVVLLVLVAIVVQAVLMSDLPRSIVVSALQKALNVKVEAQTVRAGWWGRTHVGGVKMTIPLDNG